MKNNLFVNLFDIYGKEIKINISGNEKVKTQGGSIIGVLTFLTICAYLIYQLIYILDKNSISLIYNETSSTLPVNDFSNIPIMFKLVDVTGKKIPTEGLYAIEPYIASYTVEKDSKNNTKAYSKFIPIKLESCEREKHLGAYKYLFDNINVQEYSCIPQSLYNMTLFSTFGDLVNGFSEIIVYVTKCSNSSLTSNSTQMCLQENIIMKKLSEVFFVFAHVGYELDNFNYAKPNQLKVYTIAQSITYYLLKRIYLSFMQMTYETDYGFILESRQQEKYFTLNSIFPDVTPVAAGIINSNPQIASFHIRNTEKTGHYFRSYIKLSNIIASTSGVIKIVMTVCNLLNYFLTDALANKKISNLIFSNHEEIQNFSLRKNNFRTGCKLINITPLDISKITQRLQQK
jgi:hypothetical protein